jgi:hypothetical protein
MEMTMRFMSIVKSSEAYRQGPPPLALIEAIGRLGEEATKAGAMVDMGGLLPTEAGFRLRLSGGKLTVTDGPFSEAKEVIGGYAVFSVGSKEEALEWGKRFMNLHKQHWPEWEGEAEIRQMAETPDCGQHG